VEKKPHQGRQHGKRKEKKVKPSDDHVPVTRPTYPWENRKGEGKAHTRRARGGAL